MALYPLQQSHLQLSVVGQFIIRLFSDVAAINIDLSADKDLHAAYKKLQAQSNEYDVAMKQIKAMAETQQLIELDLQRDRKVTTLRRIINSFEYSDQKQEQEAYAAAVIIMKNYAHLEEENYEKETYDIQRLLEEWDKPENAKHTATLKLDEHLKNLRTSAADFDELFNNRSGIITQKIIYDSKTLKKKILEAYVNIIKYVDGCVPIKADNSFYISLMEAINNGRHYFADILARREALAKKEAKEKNLPKEG